MALEVTVKDAAGADKGKVSVDEAALGGMIKNRLMHAATVMYHTNLRAGRHCTKSRGEVAGSTKKLYRQKGTGNARAGNRKSGTRRHGGIIHGPKPRDYSYDMPQKQRFAAVRSAVLSKIKDKQITVVDGFGVQAGPKTKTMVDALEKLGTGTALIATDGVDKNVYLSARNLPGIAVVPELELNARAILTHSRLIFTKKAFDKFMARATAKTEKHTRKPKGTRKQKPAAAAAAGK